MLAVIFPVILFSGRIQFNYIRNKASFKRQICIIFFCFFTLYFFNLILLITLSLPINCSKIKSGWFSSKDSMKTVIGKASFGIPCQLGNLYSVSADFRILLLKNGYFPIKNYNLQTRLHLDNISLREIFYINQLFI